MMIESRVTTGADGARGRSLAARQRIRAAPGLGRPVGPPPGRGRPGRAALLSRGLSGHPNLA